MIGVPAQHQPLAMRSAACERAFASSSSGRLPGSWVRFSGKEEDTPPPDKDKRGGWLGRAKGVFSKAKDLGKKTVERIQTAVSGTPAPAPNKNQPSPTPSEVAQPTATNPTPPVATEGKASSSAPSTSESAAPSVDKPVASFKPSEPTISPIPDPDQPPPPKGGVFGWARKAIPGAVDALEYVTQSVDSTLKKSFLTQVMEETAIGPHLAKMNGFARQDFDGVLLQHPVKERGFYQAVLSDGKSIVEALEQKGEDAAALGFLNEHFTQQIAQSFSLGDWQARVSLYQCMMRYVQSQKEAAIAQDQTAPEIRDVLRAVDEIQQTHPHVWHLMTALTRGGNEQTPHLQLGHLLSELIEMRNSVVPARYETLAKWFNSLTPSEVAEFVAKPDTLAMIKMDLGIQMYEPWWTAHHQEQLLNRTSGKPPGAAFAHMIYTLAEKLTPSAY